MKKTGLKFNIAAISLIEIMMIFLIIGIVTAAGAALTKPKNEFMKRLQVYSAFNNLQEAANVIKSEGQIDYSTDLNVCKVRAPIYGICLDPVYTNKFPNLSPQLPKSPSRTSSGDTYKSTTIYNSLNSTDKEIFEYLQQGLCQRLASAFQLDDFNVSCGSDNNNYIADDTSTPTSFTSYTPQLYLPNGQVIYIGKYLYMDWGGRHGLYTSAGTSGASEILTVSHMAFGQFLSNALNGTWDDDGANVAPFNHVPNETRLASVQYALDISNSFTPSNCPPLYQTFIELFTHNKDYFTVYVDINGKMVNANDKERGPDKLNSDVFCFKMYRDGSVRPAIDTGFPEDYIKADVYKSMYASGKLEKIYNNVPLIDAQVLANTSNTYSWSSGANYASTILGSSKSENDQCKKDGSPGSNCKVVVIKPSFFRK